jgi:threonine dehydratase
MKPSFSISLKSIQVAQEFLSHYLEPSPLIRNSWLSDQYGCDVYLKLENMQPIGSFKIRGATYRISLLTEEEKKKGVVAASAGNHAQGVAWGSARLGVHATIFMPKSAPLLKIHNTRMLGATVQLVGDNYDQAFEAAQEHCKKTGAIYIHAFEDPAIIAGQGVVGLEILEQLPDVDAVISSIGGGGLLAGMAIAFKEIKPSVKLYGCQASGAPSMAESFAQGHAVRLKSVDTFADGIKVMQASEPIRQILAPRLEKILLADDEAMAMSLLDLMEKAKIICEGACALSLAVLDQIRNEIRGKKIVLVMSGGNIDVNLIGRVIDRGLIRRGRRLRVNVLISDRPGSLAKLTELLGTLEANIIQAIHDRSQTIIKMDQTEVALTLETRGPEHSQEILSALKTHALQVFVKGLN